MSCFNPYLWARDGKILFTLKFMYFNFFLLCICYKFPNLLFNCCYNLGRGNFQNPFKNYSKQNPTFHLVCKIF